MTFAAQDDTESIKQANEEENMEVGFVMVCLKCTNFERILLRLEQNKWLKELFPLTIISLVLLFSETTLITDLLGLNLSLNQKEWSWTTTKG